MVVGVTSQVLPAASTPRFDYNTTTQKFARYNTLYTPPAVNSTRRLVYSVPPLVYPLPCRVTRSPLRHSSAFARAAMHRERFSLLHQRLMRHKQFAPPKFGSKQNYMKV